MASMECVVTEVSEVSGGATKPDQDIRRPYPV